jgi:hypothetical protein
MEPILFSDNRHLKVLASTGNRAGRDDYAHQWAEERRRLDDIAVRRHMGVIDLQTNSEVVSGLTKGLRRVNLKWRSRL